MTVEVGEVGFVKEEVTHQLIAVEEYPVEYIKAQGNDYISGAEYNIQKSSEDEYLLTCFNDPYTDACHRVLPHNHIMLVLRAWLTAAQWDIPYDQERKIRYCDDKGKLSISAFADTPPRGRTGTVVARRSGLGGSVLENGR